MASSISYKTIPPKKIGDGDSFAGFNAAVVSITPNPFTESTNIYITVQESNSINVKVFDLLGQVVLSQDFHSVHGSINVHLEGSGLKSGIYPYAVTVDGEVITGKISLIK